jgi:hypothetical protein
MSIEEGGTNGTTTPSRLSRATPPWKGGEKIQIASFASGICTICTILMNKELCKYPLTYLFFK